MRIFTLVTPAMAVLERDHFLATCPADLEPVVIRAEVAGDYSWGGDSFLGAVRAKLDAEIESIRKYPGEVVIWSDVDIQFFGRCSAAVQDCLQGRDIVFQSEAWPPQGTVNIGFMAMRCNDRTRALFEAVRSRDFSRLEFRDQTAMQNILDEKRLDLSWGVLPRRFWSYAHGGLPPDDILLHHATMEGVLGKKIEQLREVRRYVLARRRHRFARTLVDHVHGSRFATFLSHRIPLRLRQAVRRVIRYDDGVSYRPTCADWITSDKNR